MEWRVSSWSREDFYQVEGVILKWMGSRWRGGGQLLQSGGGHHRGERNRLTLVNKVTNYFFVTLPAGYENVFKKLNVVVKQL